jgi:hypothetical protein
MCYYTSAMPCPYFDPTERCAGGETRTTSMLPLGDAWAGVCRAAPDRPWPPDHATLLPLCNIGYARGICARFPSEAGPDAVRFAIRADDGLRLRLDYVIERDHHPFAHGIVEYSIDRRSFLDMPSGDAVARQARAYVESYLRRKSEAFRGRTASQ